MIEIWKIKSLSCYNIPQTQKDPRCFYIPLLQGAVKIALGSSISVRGLLLFLSTFFFFLHFPSRVTSFLVTLITSLFPSLLLFPFYPALLSSCSSSSSSHVVLVGPHVAGPSWWCETYGRPWLQADATLGVCVCLCVDEMEDCNVFLHA